MLQAFLAEPILFPLTAVTWGSFYLCYPRKDRHPVLHMPVYGHSLGETRYTSIDWQGRTVIVVDTEFDQFTH